MIYTAIIILAICLTGCSLRSTYPLVGGLAGGAAGSLGGPLVGGLSAGAGVLAGEALKNKDALIEAEENPLEFIVNQVKSAGVEPPNPEYIPSFKDILEQMQKAQMFYLYTKRPVKLKIKKLK